MYIYISVTTKAFKSVFMFIFWINKVCVRWSDFNMWAWFCGKQSWSYAVSYTCIFPNSGFFLCEREVDVILTGDWTFFPGLKQMLHQKVVVSHYVLKYIWNHLDQNLTENRLTVTFSFFMSPRHLASGSHPSSTLLNCSPCWFENIPSGSGMHQACLCSYWHACCFSFGFFACVINQFVSCMIKVRRKGGREGGVCLSVSERWRSYSHVWFMSQTSIWFSTQNVNAH